MNSNLLHEMMQSLLGLCAELDALDTRLLGDGRLQSVFQSIDKKTWQELYYVHGAKIFQCLETIREKGIGLCEALNYANATANEEQIRKLEPYFQSFLVLENAVENFSQSMDTFLSTEEHTLNVALIRQELLKLRASLNLFISLGKDG